MIAIGLVICFLAVILSDNLIGRLVSHASSARRICNDIGIHQGWLMYAGNVMAWSSGVLYFWSRFCLSKEEFRRLLKTTVAKAWKD